MPRISRTTYHNATDDILIKSGFLTQKIKLGYILAEKDGKRICVSINGKNLPYFNKFGKEIFEWETYLNPSRLDKSRILSLENNAESWQAFTYAILSRKYELHFEQKTKVEGILFGVRMLKTSEYKRHMRSRSPNRWDVVELPRKKVLWITNEPNKLEN